MKNFGDYLADLCVLAIREPHQEQWSGVYLNMDNSQML